MYCKLTKPSNRVASRAKSSTSSYLGHMFAKLAKTREKTKLQDGRHGNEHRLRTIFHHSPFKISNYKHTQNHPSDAVCLDLGEGVNHTSRRKYVMRLETTFAPKTYNSSLLLACVFKNILSGGLFLRKTAVVMHTRFA